MGRQTGQGVSYSTILYYGTENQHSAAPEPDSHGVEGGERRKQTRPVTQAWRPFVPSLVGASPAARGEDSTAGGAGVAVNSPTFGGMRMPRICTTVKL
ncbi:hypothetical protein V495_06103 [Pseudogymnoascus sp. VKM F-4514 (FW-929)]|nr:hypothetical protein V495_06103 [Pseudogymnoascus sp. VKM F-4514 (FW-929)]